MLGSLGVVCVVLPIAIRLAEQPQSPPVEVGPIHVAFVRERDLEFGRLVAEPLDHSSRHRLARGFGGRSSSVLNPVEPLDAALRDLRPARVSDPQHRACPQAACGRICDRESERRREDATEVDRRVLERGHGVAPGLDDPTDVGRAVDDDIAFAPRSSTRIEEVHIPRLPEHRQPRENRSGFQTEDRRAPRSCHRQHTHPIPLPRREPLPVHVADVCPRANPMKRIVSIQPRTSGRVVPRKQQFRQIGWRHHRTVPPARQATGRRATNWERSVTPADLGTNRHQRPHAGFRRGGRRHPASQPGSPVSTYDRMPASVSRRALRPLRSGTAGRCSVRREPRRTGPARCRCP